MRDPIPEHVVPMLAKLSKLPREDGGWAYEIKWDGVRAIAYVTRSGLRLESRNLNDVTARYPEVAALADALAGHEAVLDGEVVAFDEQGRPSFERLQGRMHLTTGVAGKARAVPVAYVAFDLLWLDGENLMHLPYTERRERLQSLGLDGGAWRTPGYSTGNGAELLEASARQGLEGIVAKRLDSPYEAGRRGNTWLKVKNTRRQELVIGGWQAGEGRRAGRLGALLMGFNEGGALRYAGKVGTGFDDRELEKLGALLSERERDSTPFEGRQPERGSHFVEPDLVAEVEFTEWTSQNMLRHPSYKGLRDDKRPLDVVLERAEEPTATAASVIAEERAPLLRSLIGGEPDGDAKLDLDGRTLQLTELDRVVHAGTGFTKAEALDYYLRVGPALIPHLRGREVEGSSGPLDDVASLVELVNGGAIELTVRADPSVLVFDLEADPEAVRLARALFEQLGLEAFPKTSPLQVWVPLNPDGAGDPTAGADFAVAVADTVKGMRAAGNKGPSAYSLVSGDLLTVSTPVTWDELRADPGLAFRPDDVLSRIEERGDLFAPVLTERQELPRFD